MMTIEKDMLLIRDVKKILGMGESYTRELLQKGKIRGAVKKETEIGSYWVVPREAVEAFIRLRQIKKQIRQNRKRRPARKRQPAENAGQSSSV
ncbi:MAG: helix-turn-helix domain-containing protein [Synergistaceae bacterium]|nr:helix-turn-helix domain-containing protein [Synergistaceae bacterium]